MTGLTAKVEQAPGVWINSARNWRLRLVAVAAAPAVVATLPGVVLGASLLDFSPFSSDEITYWHEIATFIRAGFGGGHYSVEEVPARATFSAFGTHGPAFPVLYGMIGSVFGWQHNTAAVVNLVMFATAGFAYLALVRADAKQVGFYAALTAGFGPIILFLTLMMQEALHLSFAVVLAGCFHALIRRRCAIPRALIVGTVVLLACAGLVKATWGLLFLPLVLIVGGRRWWPLALLAPLPSFAAGYYLMAPFPDAFLYRLTLAGTTGEAARLLAANVGTNLFGLLIPWGVDYLILLVRYGSLLLIAYYVWRAGRGDRAAALHVWNLAGVIGVACLLYFARGWEGARLFAPPLLLSLLLALADRQWRVLAAALVASIALALPFLDTYRSVGEVHYIPRDQLTAAYARFAAAPPLAGEAWRPMRQDPAIFARTIAPYVVFQEGADPWDNTLLVCLDSYGPQLLGIPPGVGLSLLGDPARQATPVRSRYLLLSDRCALALSSKAQLRLLTVTEAGGLYLNLGQGGEP